MLPKFLVTWVCISIYEFNGQVTTSGMHWSELNQLLRSLLALNHMFNDQPLIHDELARSAQTTNYEVFFVRTLQI